MVLLCFPSTDSHQGPSEEKLIWDIFGKDNEKYNNLARPVKDESESLEVKFGISLQQIIDVVRPVGVRYAV